ncbi:rRNA maturation RNase YbeY [Rubinisphaera italica]|uniref:Endoribonuclease YbeY n=1 Tax=Rubinisphaera italica TaxID=2527969 RepID=A0A5C5XFN3_9PLAN|nr:rRNA maturation RNase YbeY [Rubinisphaera italica]TWT61867.1 Endoribonuclease YbeY [Rubinisphaera italica]
MPTSENDSIEIIDEQNVYKIDHACLLISINRILEHQQVAEAELSIVLLDNAAIHQWNRDTLEHDFPTDVITFALNDPDFPRGNNRLEGELLVSVEMAVQLSKEVGWAVEQECTLYVLHGILHLLGYDDLNEADQLKMRKKEREVLLHLGIHPNPQDDRWAGL